MAHEEVRLTFIRWNQAVTMDHGFIWGVSVGGAVQGTDGPTNAQIVRGVGGVRKELSLDEGLGIVDGLTNRFACLEPLIAASTYLSGRGR